MDNPITITATVACWVSKEPYNQRELRRALESGNATRVVDRLMLYGEPDKNKFCDYIRIGEADVTLRLIPKDEQTRLAVQSLREQLAEERGKWHERQQAILAEISKLQALTFEGAEA